MVKLLQRAANYLMRMLIRLYLLPKRLLFWLVGLSSQKVSGNAEYLQPCLLCGKGHIRFGSSVNIGVPFSAFYFSGYGYIEARNNKSKVTIGDNTWINNNFTAVSAGEDGGISIGNNCLIGTCFTVYDSDFHGLEPENRSSPGLCEAVIVGNNVFIGSNVTVLRGVEIGDNSVIGAGSVVVRNIPSNVIAAGNPCRVIRQIV